MPTVDYSQYTSEQTEWAHTLLKMAAISSPEKARELGTIAGEAHQRATRLLINQNITS